MHNYIILLHQDCYILILIMKQQEVYEFETNFKGRNLSIEKKKVRTLRDLKNQIVKQLEGMMYNNIRIFKNQKTIDISDDTIVANIFKDEDRLKVMPLRNLDGEDQDDDEYDKRYMAEQERKAALVRERQELQFKKKSPAEQKRIIEERERLKKVFAEEKEKEAQLRAFQQKRIQEIRRVAQARAKKKGKEGQKKVQIVPPSGKEELKIGKKGQMPQQKSEFQDSWGQQPQPANKQLKHQKQQRQAQIKQFQKNKQQLYLPKMGQQQAGDVVPLQQVLSFKGRPQVRAKQQFKLDPFSQLKGVDIMQKTEKQSDPFMSSLLNFQEQKMEGMNPMAGKQGIASLLGKFGKESMGNMGGIGGMGGGFANPFDLHGRPNKPKPPQSKYGSDPRYPPVPPPSLPPELKFKQPPPPLGSVGGGQKIPDVIEQINGKKYIIKDYVYVKNNLIDLPYEQQFMKAKTRLISLKIPDPEYWVTVALNSEDIGQALYRSGAQQIEPIHSLQMQRHVMKQFLKRLFTHQKVIQNMEKFKTRPGLLQYYFDFRLSHPTKALKILMKDKRKEFYKLVGHWFDADTSLVLSEQQQKQYFESLPQYTDQKVVEKIAIFTKNKQKAVKLVQIAQNDLDFALKYMLEGEKALEDSWYFLTSDFQKSEVDNLAPWGQQIFLYRWLLKRHSHLLQLRILAQPHFLQIFILSLQHLLPSLSKIIVRNKPYFLMLMSKYPPERYKQAELPLERKEPEPLHTITYF